MQFFLTPISSLGRDQVAGRAEARRALAHRGQLERAAVHGRAPVLRRLPPPLACFDGLWRCSCFVGFVCWRESVKPQRVKALKPTGEGGFSDRERFPLHLTPGSRDSHVEPNSVVDPLLNRIAGVLGWCVDGGRCGECPTWVAVELQSNCRRLVGQLSCPHPPTLTRLGSLLRLGDLYRPSSFLRRGAGLETVCRFLSIRLSGSGGQGASVEYALCFPPGVRTNDMLHHI